MWSQLEPEKCLLSICFSLFVANNAYKSFRCANNCGLFNYVCSLTNKPTDQPHIEAAEVIDGS